MNSGTKDSVLLTQKTFTQFIYKINITIHITLYNITMPHINSSLNRRYISRSLIITVNINEPYIINSW